MRVPIPRWLSVLGLLALVVVAVLATWATSEPSADLFMALSGGRDVVQGKLGHPDDWSFVTASRVWYNQNWLSHLLLYQVWRLGGESGLLAWKAILLSTTAALLFAVARRRSGNGTVAALLSAGLVVACFRFVLLRPNLTTLVLVPLTMLLLEISEARRSLVVAAVPLMALWSNAHGGFVLGLGMVGLWMACVVLDDWRRAGARAMREDAWLVAVLAACVAACAVSPFGLANLLLPTQLASVPGWRTVPEWQPLLSNRWLPVPWEFFVVLGLVPVLSLASWVLRPANRRGRKTSGPPPKRELGPWLFDHVLLAVVVVMAFQSRRFVPLAILAAAPPLARLLGALVQRGHRVFVIATGIAVILSVAAVGWRNARAYRPDHPVRRGATAFDRMHMVSDLFPVEAGRFLELNHVAGSAIAAWEWEGYLRWVHPGVRVLMGGRAQQMYPYELFRRWGLIQTTDDGPRILQELGADLAILPQGIRFQRLVEGLSATGRWVCLYDDGHTLVLADSVSTTTRPLVLRALAGALLYPTESSRASSLATRLANQTPPDAGRVLAAVRQASEEQPSAQAYALLADLPVTPGDAVTAYLEQEASRLERLQPRGRGEEEIREARIVVLRILTARYRGASRVSDAIQAANRGFELYQEAAAVRRRWP